MSIRLLIMVCLLFLFSLWQMSGQLLQPTFSDLVYATVGGESLKLDLYLPQYTIEPVPLVIRVHGGAWQSGNKYPLPWYMAPILEQGLAVASVQYRLTSQAGQFGDEEVIFPAQIYDVKGAVRWLRAHAGHGGFSPHIHATVIDFLVSNLSHPHSWADINGDGAIDFLDLGILLSQWGHN